MSLNANAQIAYLAPELPALSATFVYEELLSLERRGYSVLPITVRRPQSIAVDQSALAARTHCIYDGTAVGVVLEGLLRLPLAGGGVFKAIKWLISDILEVGLTTKTASKLIFQFLAGVRLSAILKAGRCTHLHVHFAHVPTQIAMYSSALSGIPFTVVAHANDIFERGLLLKRKAERAHRMLTISMHNQHYLEGLGIAQSKLAVVRCGVSFTATEKSRGNFDLQKYTVGTLGRLVEKKGIDILIRAIAALKLSGVPIELQVAGDGPFRAELESLADTLGIRLETKFLGGLSHKEVAPWMRQLDVFVLACKQDRNGDMDGIPVVLMEAMSQSIPVVSTRLSGIPELIVHEHTGLLAEPGDVDDLVRQIRRLIESGDLTDLLSVQGREHVVREFGQETNIERLITCFGESSGAH